MRLENAQLRVEIDVLHGAEISAVSRPGGANVLAWHEWEAPVPADTSMTYGDSQSDWLSRYRGGWQELFPNAGVSCVVHGVPVGFHGETSLGPWEVLSAAADRCELRAAARLPLVITRRMSLAQDRPVLLIEETVTNVSDLEVPYLWGHHPVFPALAGAVIDLPGGGVRPEPDQPAGLRAVPTRWPHGTRVDGTPEDLSTVPAGRLQRLLYLTDLEAAWVALRQPAGHPGVAMAWDREAFAALWLWLLNGTDEFPWFGRARMLGIEPQTAAPYDGLAAAHGRGEAHVLGPRASRDAWLTMVVLDDDDDRAVRSVDRTGTVLRDPA